MAHPPRRIGLLSPPIGNGNLGDEAIVAAVIQNIRRRFPGVMIYALSANSADTERRHQVPAFPATPDALRRPSARIPRAVPSADVERPRISAWARLRRWLRATPLVYEAVTTARWAARGLLTLVNETRFLAGAARHVRGTDILVLTGSGVLSDHFGGAANFPWTVFRWTVLAKMAGARVAVLSAGAGPLESFVSRALVRWTLALASYRSCRDETSRRIVDTLGLRPSTPVVPDLAHSLDIPVISSARTGHQPLVGINAFPHGDSRYWPVADHILYQRYVRALAAFAYWLLENKHCVYFFPTQLRADPPVIADVRALLVQEGGEHLARQAIERPIAGVADLLATLADTDFVIATRFHAIALALRVQTPVVAISNHHKMADLMIAMNQAPYLLDIKTVTAEALIDRFTLLKLNGEAVRNEIKRRVTANQHILDRQYDLALGPTSVA